MKKAPFEFGITYVLNPNDGEKEIRAHELKERRAGQPFFRKQYGNEVGGDRRKSHHHGSHDKGAESYGAHRHGLYFSSIVLLQSHSGKQDGNDGGVYVIDYNGGELMRLIEKRKILRGIYLSNDYSSYLVVRRSEKICSQYLKPESQYPL